MGVADLIEVVVEPAQVAKSAGAKRAGGAKAVKGLTPTRARIVPDKPR